VSYFAYFFVCFLLSFVSPDLALAARNGRWTG
jgi:hypothetical protein